MLWPVEIAAALKSSGYGLESLLARHLENGSLHWRGAWYVNFWLVYSVGM